MKNSRCGRRRKAAGRITGSKQKIRARGTRKLKKTENLSSSLAVGEGPCQWLSFLLYLGGTGPLPLDIKGGGEPKGLEVSGPPGGIGWAC